MNSEVYKKNFTIGEILSFSWEIFTKNFKLIASLFLSIYIPLSILSYRITLKTNEENLVRELTLNFIIGIIALVASLAVIYVAKQTIDNKSTNFTESIEFAISKWLPAITTNILMGILLVILFILLIVPGIIFSIYWAFVLPIVALKDIRMMKALDYSKSIVQGRWWKLLGYLVVITIVGILAGIGIGIGEGIIIYVFLQITNNMIIPVIIISTFNALMTAYFVVVSTVLFVNFDSTKKLPTSN